MSDKPPAEQTPDPLKSVDKNSSQPVSTPLPPTKNPILETPPQGTLIPQMATLPVSPVPDKKAIPETPPQGTPIPMPPATALPTAGAVTESVKTESPTVAIPASAAALPDIENPYLLSGEIDRARLVAQSRLFRGYIEKNAKEFVGENIKSILDIGCGEGQLSLVFARLYPDAQVIGIDKDEQAIAVAQRAAKGISNIKFEVGDIQQGLPPGPFDLVYESMVLMHVAGTPKVLQAIYDVLNPGGRLWTKDVDPNNASAVDHPAYVRLSDWLGTALDKIGSPYRVGAELPPLLANAGLNMVRLEREGYMMGNESTQERITMSINLGAFYNARKLLSRVLQVSETEIEKIHRVIIEAMTAPGGPQGEFKYINIISQRPVQSVAVPVTPQSETPALAMPESVAALPDLENPYLLSGEVDRARLVAQTRLFRGYIERNAKQFVGENRKSILDMGCGEGQLTLVFARLYPEAQIIGIDKDAKAIEVAQRAAKDVANVKFEVRDVVLEGLPAEQFDLVYESMVLMHISSPQVLKAIYDALTPGGRLWSKDFHPNWATAVDHPVYLRYMDWLVSALDKAAAPWRVAADFPPKLTAAGFKVLRTEKEVYPVGNMSAESRITMSINLGAPYNMRKFTSKMIQVPETDIENAYKETIAAMLAPGGPHGEHLYINTVAERPASTDKVSTSVATEAMSIPASGSAALPDTKTSS